MHFAERESTIWPIMENRPKIDIKSLPFEERVDKFKRLVQAIGLGVGGDEEYNLRRLGDLIVEYHGLKTHEDKDRFKEEKISPMYDKLGEVGKRNPEIAGAVVNVIMAEAGLF